MTHSLSFVLRLPWDTAAGCQSLFTLAILMLRLAG
jgi:hypothetical protein